MTDLKRILVIRRDNIGDLVCTTPAIAALRKYYPDSEIGALVNSYNADVLRRNPNVDRIFVYQKLKHAGSMGNQLNALSKRLRLMAQIRRWMPDAAILAKSSYDIRGLNLARQVGAKIVIGYVPQELSQFKRLPDILLNAPEFNEVHEVQAVNALLKPLGIEDVPGPLQVFPDPSLVEEFQHKLPAATKRIALHVSARESERRWGIVNFIALTKHILESRPDTQVLLFWSPGKVNDPRHPGDDELAAQLIEAIKNERLVPMPTKCLAELIASLSLCDLFIGTDGGAMHLAVALNRQILALFENLPSKLNHWYPWQVTHRIVHSQNPRSPDISQISLNQVEHALNKLGY